MFKRRLSNWLLIRTGEEKTVLYLSLLYLALGAGMAVGRSSSDALLFKRFGVEFLPQMFFLTSLLLVVFSAAYAEFADRIHPARTFRYIVALTGAFLVATWLMMQNGDSRFAFAVYFLGYGVVSEILVVHFCLYASGFLDVSQSKRLSPLINAASRLGGVIGGVALGLLSSRLPTEHMALVWALTLAATFVLISAYHRGEQRPRTPGRPRKHAKPLAHIREGLEFARHSRLLQIAGLTLFVMIVLISAQDYLVSSILTRHFRDERDLTAFFGWFFAFTNFAVLLLQILATNRLLRRFGLKVVSLIFPWSTAASFALLSLSASFIPAVIGRFNYTGMMPAFRNPAANLFYSALPAYMQGRARALSIGLILPLGLAVSGLLLMWVPKEAVGESLAVFGLLLSFVYIYLKSVTNRVYADSLAQLIQQQVFAGAPREWEEAGRMDERVVRELEQLLRQSKGSDDYLAYAEFLLAGAPQEAGAILLETLASRPAPVQDRLLPRLAELAPSGWHEYARRCLAAEDFHLQATALYVLAERGDAHALNVIHAWLAHPHPRLRAAAARACFTVQDPTLHEDAERVLGTMLDAQKPSTLLAALSVVSSLELSTHGDAVQKLLQHADADVRAAAIVAAGAIGDVSARLMLLAKALQDEDAKVRRTAEKHADALMPVTEAEYAAALDAYFPHFRMQARLANGLAKSDLAQRRALLLAIAQRHLQRAWDKKSVALQAASLAQQVPAEQADEARFLCVVLNEEVQRHIEFALATLTLLDEAQMVQGICAALASRDRRLRAQALESLRHIENNALVEWLLPLVEAEHDGAYWKHPAPETLRTTGELISWCGRQGGQWLRRCAAGMGKETTHATPI